jgi:hypothetical protein
MSENIQSNIYTISVYQLQRCSSSLKPPNANGAWSVRDPRSTSGDSYPLQHSFPLIQCSFFGFSEEFTSADIIMGLHTVDVYPQGDLGVCCLVCISHEELT